MDIACGRTPDTFDPFTFYSHAHVDLLPSTSSPILREDSGIQRHCPEKVNEILASG